LCQRRHTSGFHKSKKKADFARTKFSKIGDQEFFSEGARGNLFFAKKWFHRKSPKIYYPYIIFSSLTLLFNNDTIRLRRNPRVILAYPDCFRV